MYLCVFSFILFSLIVHAKIVPKTSCDIFDTTRLTLLSVFSLVLTCLSCCPEAFHVFVTSSHKALIDVAQPQFVQRNEYQSYKEQYDKCDIFAEESF